MTRIIALDHIVLKSSDVERSLRFYCEVLGLQGMRVEEWRTGEVRFPSVRITEDTLIDLFPAGDPAADATGQHLDHYCLVVAPGELDGLLDKVIAFGIEPGPKLPRWGAHGEGESAYVTGPEGVTIELRHYPNQADVAGRGAARGS